MVSPAKTLFLLEYGQPIFLNYPKSSKNKERKLPSGIEEQMRL